MMNPDELKDRNFETEFIFSSSRSGGPGGQNVNKVSSKVELRFNVTLTSLFSESEKDILAKRLKNKINKEGELILVSQSERTQLLNKKVVIAKFYDLVAKMLTIPANRRITRPTRASMIKRLEGKRNHGYKKKLRNQKGESPE